MRQVEVLYDQLLALFDRDPSLRPEQVVVMMPEVDTFAASYRGRVRKRAPADGCAFPTAYPTSE